MGIFDRVKRAYTLAEIIIVLVVIAVVVAVTMRVAKMRLDNITTYTYYSAYGVLNDVTAQMLADFNPNREEYTEISSSVHSDYSNLFLFLPKFVWVGGELPVSAEEPPCTQKTAEQQQQDYCDNGYTDYNSETCDYDTKPGTWPDCPAGTHWDSTVPDCKCVPDNATVPRKGANFCNMFVSLANTRTGTMCNGSAVAADTTDFSDITADIVLRNGMRIFNASQDPATIPDLSLTDHTGAKITKADGTEIYTDEFGYVLYIDIDGGRNGGSVLWEDVFPFYVTLSGKVIPAYKTDAIAQFGGGSRYYLQTSLQVDSVDALGATQFWLDGAKSISFRQAACMSGYVGAATQYCSRTPAVTESATCSEENNSCSIKKVSPIRWF